jgi:Fe-S-cluster containining protein
MSPINGGECPHLIWKDKYCFCTIYESRPKECSNHKFDTQFCPIGLSHFKFNGKDIDKIGEHLKLAYKLFKEEKQ